MSSTRWVARALWLVPAFLIVICGQQVWAAYTIGQTVEHGTPAVAEVTDLEQSNRVDVTYDYMSLRVALPGGDTLTRRRMSVSHTLVPLLENKQQLAVWVRPGAAQEIVIREAGPYGQPIGHKQQRIAVVQAAMSGVAAIMFAIGVWWWNRYLRRRGDPSEEAAGQREEDYSASRTTRR